MRIKKILSALLVASAFGVGMLTHADFFPSLSTYGVSVGTNAHYCSLDVVHLSFAVSCESVQ